MWMPKEHLCVLVYLITAMHSMQGGYLDKAQKYTDKALIQIDKLRSEFPKQNILFEACDSNAINYIPLVLEQQPILNTFQLLLLEQIIMCRLVMGNKALALQVNKHKKIANYFLLSILTIYQFVIGNIPSIYIMPAASKTTHCT